MSEHTKEPKWHSQVPWGATKEHEGYRIHGPTNDCIARGLSLVDAKRIVACVNACVGLSTEALEAGVIRRAATLMSEHEWNSGDSGGGYGCHDCYQTGEHQDGCTWADTLAKLEGK